MELARAGVGAFSGGPRRPRHVVVRPDGAVVSRLHADRAGDRQRQEPQDEHGEEAEQIGRRLALAAFGRVYVGPASGYATDPKYLGLSWTVFFFLTFLIALPGLVLLWWKRDTLKAL